MNTDITDAVPWQPHISHKVWPWEGRGRVRVSLVARWSEAPPRRYALEYPYRTLGDGVGPAPEGEVCESEA